MSLYSQDDERAIRVQRLVNDWTKSGLLIPQQKDRILPELQVHSHYQRNAWTPHVTLSGALSDPGQAIAALVPFWRPVSGVLNRLDLAVGANHLFEGQTAEVGEALEDLLADF